MKLKTIIKKDYITKEIESKFDFIPDNEVCSYIPDFEIPSDDFSIGLIIGGSGSGKTTILKAIGEIKHPEWDNEKAIASHFDSFCDARDRLGASGLNSIPAWYRPFHTLSNGEQYRANLSRLLEDNAIIDEFTSVVDRNVAKSCATAVSKYIKRTGKKRIIFASCHYDICEWLEPDWIYECESGSFIDWGRLRRPEIEILLEPSITEAWSFFSKHHYLTGSINKSARCWVARWDGVLVGFASAISFPSGSIKNAWRGHRTVVLPEFQGLGIGARISDAIGEIFISQGCRYFSKTAHPILGEYREKNENWKPTSKNKMARKDYCIDRKTKEDKHKMLHKNRVCYSHEYIGRA